MTNRNEITAREPADTAATAMNVKVKRRLNPLGLFTAPLTLEAISDAAYGDYACRRLGVILDLVA